MEPTARSQRGTTKRRSDLIAAIDGWSKPTFLVDVAGLMKHANPAGEKALRHQDMLLLRNGRLAPVNSMQGRELDRLIGEVTRRGGVERFHRALRMVDARGNASGVLFAHAAGSLSYPDEVRAALILADEVHDPEVDAMRLRITFGFTSAEDRLARDLIRGSSLKDAGQKYRLGRETLKSQLGSLFRKTGTHRQGELVAFLLSSLSDPSA